MVELARVVDNIRDDLKKLYLSDRMAVWHHPFVAIIKRNDVETISGASSEAAIVEWLKVHRNAQGGGIAGIVIGRMVAKYSKVLTEADGSPKVSERAILVSGRVLSTGQTYISITPCLEHKDLRNPENYNKNKDDKHDVGFKSPDKVEAIVGDNGAIHGFVEMQFGKETVLDSRKGDVCLLDPIIQGVIDTGTAEKYV